MKTIIKYIILPGTVLGASALLQSCAMETPFGNGGEGTLSINTEIKGETKKTRGDNTLDNQEYYSSLEEKCVVFIENSRGVMRKYKGVANIPSTIRLSSGDYVCNAWTGDSVPASFSSKFYRGKENFTINEDQQTALELKCNIANVVVSVDAASVAEVGLNNPKVTFSTTRGQLEFTQTEISNGQKGYFMTPSPEVVAQDAAKYAANTLLTVKIEGTLEDGTPYVKTAEVKDVQRAHEYSIHLSKDEQQIGEGGALIRIEVKDIEIIEDEVEVFTAPVMEGIGFDIADQIVNTSDTFADTKLRMAAYGSMKNIKMTVSDNFGDILTAYDNILLPEVMEAFAAKGILIERHEVQEEGSDVRVDEVYVTFYGTFLNGLPASTDEYAMSFEATDSRDLVSTAALRIANTPDAIATVDDAVAGPAPDPDTNPMAVSVSKATLTGTLYNQDAVSYGFKYRKAGDAQWQTATANGSNGKPRRTRAACTPYSITLTGLEEGTTYEYKAFADEFESTTVQTFTTESKFILPNASMEDWSTYTAGTLLGDKAVTFPGSGSEPTFWDSGNEGAATANQTLTNKSTDMVHSGTYSARLESKKIFGMIAAGNIFAGDYVRTDGTNGVLALGREYNGSHPAKLRVYANYRPGTTLTIKSGNEAFVTDLTESGCDNGQIYVALTVGTVEIRTKPEDRKLFSPDDEQVLAYGQVTWQEAFGPDGQLQPIEIPIVYNERANTTKPTHLVITCCASKFGDYFSGAAGSVMYLDDFELVYE